jgi:Flp pilus assembly protein TadG
MSFDRGPLMTLTSLFRRFARDSRGSVALMFGLAALVLVGGIGAAVDYSRAARERQEMQDALDAAALAGRRDLHLGVARARTTAQAFWRANAPSHLRSLALSITAINEGRTLRVAPASPYAMRTSVLGVVGIAAIPIAAAAEATRGGQEIEIALVLDNTGSMVNDMNTLRRAARDLVTRVMDGGETIRISVVPYVAAVNPGRAALGMSMMDTGAEGRWHAAFLRDQYLAQMTGCTWPWERNPQPPSDGGGGGGGGGYEPPEPPDTGGGRGAWNLPGGWTVPGLPGRFGAMLAEIVGVRAAQAAGGEVTPNTRTPLTGTWVTGTPSGRALLPTGFEFWDECGLYNPSRISHFDLFARIPGAQWKGCVEARPEPHDVQDTVPSRGTPDTLFVPYFWADERNGLVNNYMDDGAPPTGWTAWANRDWEATWNILKYDGAARTRGVNESGPNTSGPNMACPDEILPLTNNRATILAKIDGLRHWNGGGTINSEGVMWGWRALSPEPPFTEGAAWARVRNREVTKIIVFMSDGMNELGINGSNGDPNDRDSETKSHYTSYGYLRDGRFPIERFDRATEHLNERQRLACQNVKATGIVVFSVLFRERNPTARDLMRNCASEGRFYYEAVTAAELERAFSDIAGYIGRLRISR